MNANRASELLAAVIVAGDGKIEMSATELGALLAFRAQWIDALVMLNRLADVAGTGADHGEAVETACAVMAGVQRLAYRMEVK